MEKKNTYTVSVGNVGCMEYTSKGMAEQCYLTYVNLSRTGQTRAAGEDVVLMCNDVVLKEYVGTLNEGCSE